MNARITSVRVFRIDLDLEYRDFFDAFKRSYALCPDNDGIISCMADTRRSTNNGACTTVVFVQSRTESEAKNLVAQAFVRSGYRKLSELLVGPTVGSICVAS